MYESRKQPPLSDVRFARRMLGHLAVAMAGVQDQAYMIAALAAAFAS